MKPSDDAESRKQPQKLQQQQHNLRDYYKITSDLLLWNKMIPSQKLNKEIKNHNSWLYQVTIMQVSRFTVHANIKCLHVSLCHDKHTGDNLS